MTQMLATGLHVGIGTDGPASNNDLDHFEEMRLAALLAKGSTRDPVVLPARTALAMATIEGARALHIGELTGSLEPGKRADLIVLNMSALHNTPQYYQLSTQPEQRIHANRLCQPRHRRARRVGERAVPDARTPAADVGRNGYPQPRQCRRQADRYVPDRT